MIVLFKFLRNLYTIFWVTINLHYHPESVRWPLIVVLVVFFLMISWAVFSYSSWPHVYHLFGKCLFKSSVHFKLDYLGVFVFVLFCYWVLWVPYIIWIFITHLIYGMQMFSPFPRLPFHLLLLLLFFLLCRGFFSLL